VLTHLAVATAAGGLIGLERTYHSRPAGFRTHTLVCLASALLMLLPMYEGSWFGGAPAETVRLDPTRMAQGIMTGIGFLGAGVIMREGLSVRGLTTAASIWITAAIGILAGAGMYDAVALATIVTLGTLTVFRLIERRMPAQRFARLEISFRRAGSVPEGELRQMLSDNGFEVGRMSRRLHAEGDRLEYRMTVHTMNPASIERLTAALAGTPAIVEFTISQESD